MDKLWIILIFILIAFSIFVSIKIKFENYNISNIIKSINNKNKSGLFLSLGTKIGVGSIIGTTMSIYIGGPGSVLWLLLFSFLTSSLIYYESYVGSLYSEVVNGVKASGPFFYIKKCLNNKMLSYIFLILLIMCYSLFFQMIQTNTITNILELNLNINKHTITIILLIILLFMVIFSLKELISSMNKIVPIMCLLYILLGLIIILINIESINNIIKNIVTSAFTKRGILVGCLIGIKRSIFASEIMIGTSSTASGIDCVSPKESGYIQTLGVYFITFVICIITSLIVLIFKENNVFYISNYNELISKVFIYHFGNIGIIILIVIIILFSVTTIISGFYIGESNLRYITNNKYWILIFKLFVVLFCISGVYLSTDIVWQMIDAIMFILIILNIYSLYKIIRNKKYD